MKQVLAAVVLLLLVIGGVSGYRWYRNVQENAGISRLRLLQAESSYLEALDRILRSQANPESSSDASVFVSAGAINSVLSGMEDTTIQVPKLKQVSISIRKLTADFRDGFPSVDAQFDLSSTNPNVSTVGQLYCVLEPRVDPSDPSKLSFRIVPLYAELGGRVPLKSAEELRGARTILGDLLNQQQSLAPRFDLPLSNEFAIAFPANHVSLPVPTPAGQVIGELDLPGLDVKSAIRISGVIFLSDGIHVFVSTHPKTDAEVGLPYQVPPEMHVSSGKEQDAEIRKEEQSISDTRERLAPAATKLKVDKADLRIWISKTLIGSVNDVFNGLSPEGRTVVFHSEDVQGQLMKSGGGALGCGYYVELAGKNDLKGKLTLSNLASEWKPNGLAESVTAAFSFGAQVTGHINGPAGPHTFWVSNCGKIFGVTQCLPPVPSVTISCDTPIGGGVGVGGYGVSGDRTERLTATLALRSDPKNWLLYDLSLTAPDTVPITISVGLGQLGTVGIPVSFNVPHQTLLSGSAPSLFSQQGQIEIPGTSFKKQYRLDLTPTSGAVLSDGYAALGTLSVGWQ